MTSPRSPETLSPRRASASRSKRTPRLVALLAIIVIAALGIMKLHNEASRNFLDSHYVGNVDHKHLPPTHIVLDVENMCPRSSAINTISNNSPPPELMPLDEVRNIVKYWHEINCPQKDTCRFSSIGQHLLHIAMKRNQTLLSVQVAM
jgi:hypothetical protein